MLKEKPLLLVVDDEPRFRFALETCFENDFEVVTARDGEEALEVVRQRIPRLIILDLSMPRMNGREFTRQLNERFGKARPPIIVMTAHAEPERVAEMAALGVQSYFLKPVSLEALEQRVQDLLDPARAEGALSRVRAAEGWAAAEPPMKALERIAELLEHDPLNRGLRLVAAKVAILNGDLATAKYHAQVATASDEECPAGDLLLAYCEEQLGQTAAAQFHSKRAAASLQKRLAGEK